MTGSVRPFPRWLCGSSAGHRQSLLESLPQEAQGGVNEFGGGRDDGQTIGPSQPVHLLVSLFQVVDVDRLSRVNISSVVREISSGTISTGPLVSVSLGLKVEQLQESGLATMGSHDCQAQFLRLEKTHRNLGDVIRGDLIDPLDNFIRRSDFALE